MKNLKQFELKNSELIFGGELISTTWSIYIDGMLSNMGGDIIDTDSGIFYV